MVLLGMGGAGGIRLHILGLVVLWAFIVLSVAACVFSLIQWNAARKLGRQDGLFMALLWGAFILVGIFALTVYAPLHHGSGGGRPAAPAPAGAAAPPVQQFVGGGGGGVRAVCAADVKNLCPEVTPGPGGGTWRCLREHYSQISDSCRTTFDAARARRRSDGQAQPENQSAPNQRSPG
jgi:hypothetical protein